MTGESTEVTDTEVIVRAYYEALDSHDYGRLDSLLAPEFRHVRPDLTLEGRAEFVEFMRERRPVTETTHPIDTVYRAESDRLAVEGRLVDADGTVITGFVDLVSIRDGVISEIRTYTD